MIVVAIYIIYYYSIIITYLLLQSYKQRNNNDSKNTCCYFTNTPTKELSTISMLRQIIVMEYSLLPTISMPITNSLHRYIQP